MQCYRFFYYIPVENSVRVLSDSMSSRLYQDSIAHYTDAAVYTDLFVGLTSDAYVTYNSDLESYVKEAGIKFIIGESDLDTDWDSLCRTYCHGRRAGPHVPAGCYNAVNGTLYSFAELFHQPGEALHAVSVTCYCWRCFGLWSTKGSALEGAKSSPLCIQFLHTALRFLCGWFLMIVKGTAEGIQSTLDSPLVAHAGAKPLPRHPNPSDNRTVFFQACA
jgi:hypothetical protein